MKKKNLKRLSLYKETLRLLDDNQMKKAAGRACGASCFVSCVAECGTETLSQDAPCEPSNPSS
ncbi:MAG TPA: class I lanthipeptide [Thermoanaerobaculia bacterium]|jgi:hypothetical protein